MSLRELYQEMIVDHGKNPRNFGKLEKPCITQVGHNPLCGDMLTVFIKKNAGKIEGISFEGKGCAISVASASLMTEVTKGKTTAEIYQLFDLFHYLVTEGKEPEKDIGKLAAFSGVFEYPVRVKCATLAWHTLKAALANDSKIVTTE